MQPLVDLLFGKRVLGGSSGTGGKYYHKYGPDRSGHVKSSDMELSSSRNNMSRRKKDDFEDGLGTLDAKGSEESILRQGQHCGRVTHVQTGGSAKNPFSGGIVRTDVFAVSYDTDSEHGRTTH